MDIYEAIKTRRTVREFSQGASEEQLRKIMLAGARAPSAMNRQPWEFIVVNDPEIIGKIAEQKYRFHIINGAPEALAVLQRDAYRNASVVAVCYQGRDANAGVAAWMAALNMELAATAEGLACVTSTMAGEPKEAVEKILGLPDGYQLATVLVIGVPVSIPARRGPCQDREDFSWLHFNRFGSAA